MNDIDILKMYLNTKNELSRSRLSKVRALRTDTQTDAPDNILPRRIRGW